MPTPVIGIFSESSTETVFSLVSLIALELMQSGLKVVVVDGDPGSTPLTGMAAQQIPPGTSFSALLHNPDATPQLLDITKVLGNPRTLERGGRVSLVPAVSGAEVPDPKLVSEPPLQGGRRFLSLRDSLALAASGADLALLVAPVGRSPLGISLLAHGCDVAVFLADNSAKQVLWLAQMAREADARRGALIPSLCVETRDDGTAVPEGAWQQLWRSNPSLLPPDRRGDEGPERLLILDEDGPDPVALSKAVQELAGAGAELSRRGGPSLNEAGFHALYQEDRQHALAMFNQEIAPRTGTRASAVSALQAVWDSPDRSLEDVQHLAKFVVQKFRWEEPTEAALELAPIYQALLDAVDRGELTEGQSRVLIDAAAMSLHEANWRRGQGEDVAPLLTRSEALLMRSLKLPRRPQDSLRCALVLGMHSRLSGSAEHYDLALEEMRGAGKGLARVQVLRSLVDVVGDFAHSNPKLWHTAAKLSNELVEIDPRYGYWSLAIAQTHLGHRRNALVNLWHLGNLDRESYLMAFTDPDLAPLWEGAGRPDYAFDPPTTEKPMR